MDIKNIVVVILLVAVLIASVVQTFQLNELQSRMSATGAATAMGAGQIDTTDWTDNEKMNYEMHGTIPARFGGGGSAGASMVGGC
ncbi:hypothetical protein HYU50_00385 [Candidatus Woesearchaeota archaeon]|nr:hypothetical protein [Candidatus Woesearchaeota archaeon]